MVSVAAAKVAARMSAKGGEADGGLTNVEKSVIRKRKVLPASRFVWCAPYKNVWFLPFSIAFNIACNEKSLFHGLTWFSLSSGLNSCAASIFLMLFRIRLWNGYYGYYGYRKVALFFSASPTSSQNAHRLSRDTAFKFHTRQLQTVYNLPTSFYSSFVRTLRRGYSRDVLWFFNFRFEIWFF